MNINSDILQQARQIQWTARHIATAQLQGNYHSFFKGTGMEFSQSREYIDGDDAKHLDWNVTARMGKPFIKQYQEEREIVLMLAIDVSRSTNFGTKLRFKNELIAEFAAVIAYAAMDNGDKVGLIAFSDQIEAYLKPRRGSSAIWQVIRTILEIQPEHHTTDLNVGLNFLQTSLKSHANLFLISDFLTAGFEKNLSALRQRHHMTAVMASDSTEIELPHIGELTLKDQETGKLVNVSTGSFLRNRTNTVKQLQQFLKSYKIDFLQIYPDQPYMNDLLNLFQSRKFKSSQVGN